MSDLLAIGASGARTYQTALNTTSENIANAATPGYSRRSTIIKEVGRTNSIALGQTVKLSGSGSHVTGITRAVDAFKAAEVRSSGADLARTEAGVVWIDRIEGALVGNQLSDRLAQFFASAKNLAADSAAAAPRTVLLEDARSLAAGFASTGLALKGAAEELDAQGRDAAKQLGDLSESLVRINRGLTRATANSSPQAQLLDERDRLLDAMTGITNINVAIDDYGRATVRAGGATGPVIADLENAALITFASNDTGAVSISASHGQTTSAIEPSGGMMAGLIDGAARIASARDTLGVLAKDFVDQTTTLQAAGRTLDNLPGEAMFTITGRDPTTMLVNPLIDGRGIAAASVGEGPRGNGNMTALANLRVSADWEGKFDDVVTENAALLATRRNVAEAQGSIHNAAVAARDGVIGVDLDEEAVNLIRFQQAYQASSRVIQVARDILQTIIDIR